MSIMVGMMPEKEVGSKKQGPKPHSNSTKNQQKIYPDEEAAVPFRSEKHRLKRCCGGDCNTLVLLAFLLAVVGATAGITYLAFQPQVPKYSVHHLRVSDLTLNFDRSLSARFSVGITAHNPNKIGIYYEKGSRVSVWYNDTNLCQGSIPEFYQGEQNRTALDVALTGRTEYGGDLVDALQQNGTIPLHLNINAPASIKIGGLKLRKVRILGSCTLVVDSLSANTSISIQTSTCHFGLKL